MSKVIETARSSKKNADGLFLVEVDERCNNTLIIVICRKWDTVNLDGRFISTDFIISDKKGNIFHCLARSNIAHYFSELEEGCLYSIKEFVVNPNRNKYRIMRDNPYMIELQGSTIVRRVNDSIDGFVRFPFDFCSFEELIPTKNKYFVDVIGYVTDVDQPCRGSGGFKRVEFTLRDEKGRKRWVTLWGSLGDEMIAKKEQQHEPYTIILTSMNVKMHLGNLGLSSSPSTLILDNDEIYAIQDFKTRMSNVPIVDTWLSIMQVKSSLGTLKQLLYWARQKKYKVAVFRGKVQITKINTKNGWFQYNCNSGKCRKGLSCRKGQFWCECCKTHVLFSRIRYRVEAYVMDDTAATTIVLFNETAKALLKCSAKTLLREHEEGASDTSSILPAPLENLIGTWYIMETKSNNYYHYGEFESFTCLNITTLDADKLTTDLPLVSLSVSHEANNTQQSLSLSQDAGKGVSIIPTLNKKTDCLPKKGYTEYSDPEGLTDDMCYEEFTPANHRARKRTLAEIALWERKVEDESEQYVHGG